MDISYMFSEKVEEFVEGALRVFHWSSKVISKNSKGVSRKFNWCF